MSLFRIKFTAQCIVVNLPKDIELGYRFYDFAGSFTPALEGGWISSNYRCAGV